MEWATIVGLAVYLTVTALNALHRALVAIESADTDLREAQDNSQRGDFPA